MSTARQQTIDLIRDAETAAAALQPSRLEILEALREPDSAAGVARRLGQPRQRVGYHLRELERRGLVRHVEDRKRGNCVERIVQATARHYLVSPSVLGSLAADPSVVLDRFSSAYQVAVVAKTLRDVALLQEGARQAGRKLPTMTLQTDVRFANAAAQSAFAEDLANALAQLVSRYHDEAAEGARTFRFTLTGHPAPASEPGTTTEEP
jgi:DNA-binding transcriptional ArsR family regulator